MRKLVQLKKIDSILPIENADAIEIIKIGGWQLVSKKGEFKVNDYCLYFEIDSFLPEREEFEFLRKSSFKQFKGQSGFRLKTIRLRGQLSQGLALPVAMFQKDLEKALQKPIYDNPFNYLSNELAEEINNLNLEELLNVVKYEVEPEFLPSNATGGFPSFLSKTDQERVQNIWASLPKDIPFEVTIKLDGTSATFFYNEGDLGVCSRNLRLKFDNEILNNGLRDLEQIDKSKRTTDSYVFVGIKQNIFNVLKYFGEELKRNYAFQGELIGPGIQQNKEKLDEHKFFLFDIYDIDQKRYLTPKERFDLLDSVQDQFTIDSVPRLSDVKLKDFEDLDSLLLFAEGKSLINDNREGLVFKSLDLINNEVLSFKVISNKFLLKYE